MEYTYESVLKLISDFLEKYPKTEFGPAHIVLSDDNLSDDHINWCKQQFERILDPNFNVRLAASFEIRWKEDSTKELLETYSFLNELLKIPEAIRTSGYEEWNDD